MVKIEKTSQNERENQGSADATIFANIHNGKVRDFIMKKVIPNIDILIDSFRPGVMERLELGPADVHAINPNLIYVRVSGYGHATKLNNKDVISKAGRDVNFLAASGVLSKFRRNDKVGPPVIPANLLSYYCSGSTFVFVQILRAIIDRKPRQVLDCNLTAQLAYTS